MGDALEAALAAEEHRHGMAYGDDKGHCDGCSAEARRRLQAECGHDGEQIDISALGKATLTLLCQRCGATWEVERG